MSRSTSFNLALLLLCAATPFGAAAAFGAATPFADRADSLFQEGNEAYRSGEYDRAIRSFEEIRETGLENGAIHYNLGNAYYKGGNLGLAVVHYRRALRLLPRDRDIRANLDFVMERTLDREIVTADIPPWRLATTISALLTWQEWLWAAEAIYGASLCILALFLVRPTLQPRLRDPLYVAVGLLIIVGALFAISLHQTTAVERGVVTASEMPARSGPGDQFTREFLLHEGCVVTIHRQAEGWIYCSLSADLKGWLPLRAVERI